MHELVINGQTGWVNEPEEYQDVNNAPLITNSAEISFLHQDYMPMFDEQEDVLPLPPPLIAPKFSRSLTRNEEAYMDDGQHENYEVEDEDEDEATYREGYFAYDDEEDLEDAEMVPPAINWAVTSAQQRTPQRKRRGCGCNHHTPVQNHRQDDDEDLLIPPTMNW